MPFPFRRVAIASLLNLLPFAALAQEGDLRLDRVRESLTGQHRHYQQYLDGLPVVGGERTVSDLVSGRRVMVESLAERISSRQAAALAAPVRGGTAVYLNVGGEALRAWKIVVEERPLERFARYYDAATGLLLRSDPLFFTARGRVFDPNPVAKLNDPSLQDGNNAASAVPDSAYSVVDLPDLASSGPLSGPNIVIAELEPPVTPQPDSAQSLLFDRSQPQFEAVNAYFHLDRSQRYLQSLGYSGLRRIIDYPLPVDPHAANATDNSYFVPSVVAGRGELYFGDGGTDDAEDSDIMLHEYGHAIEEWIAPGTFGGSSSSQQRAIAEGFGDYWSFSSTYVQTVASGRDPYCIADWDARCAGDDASERCGYPAGADCLRRVDGRKSVSDYSNSSSSGTEHRNGEIWSSALREIFIALSGRYGVAEGKRQTDLDVIESHFGVPPNPTFAIMAGRMIESDRILNRGANTSVICSAMSLRGILGPGDCDRSPRGEITYFQSATQELAIPENNTTGLVSLLQIDDPRTIRRASVRLDVAHTARGDLRISLVAPDGTEVVLQNPSTDRTADIHVTYGVDAQPAQSLDALIGNPARGLWQLRIADVHPLDTGTLLNWSLALQLEDDAPLTARPAATGDRLHIAAVAHAQGANGTNFVTDLRLFNRGVRDAALTLIFTPAGADGTTTFSAVQVVVRRGQIVRFADVVAELFAATGAGQLEIRGDVGDIAATSRTFNNSSSGTYGQFIPAAGTADAGSGRLLIPQLQTNARYRSNAGIAEVAGASGVVEVTIYDAVTGRQLSQQNRSLAPFSFVQFPLPDTGSLVAELRVIEGAAKILAYGSVIENSSGDAIYVPAAPAPPSGGAYVAPAISAAGALATRFQSEVWITNGGANGPVQISALFVDAKTGERVDATFSGPAPHASVRFSDLLPDLFGRAETFGLVRITLPAAVVATSRIFTGAYGQYVPYRSVDDPRLLVPAVADRTVLHAENSSRFRSNIGVANLGGLTARLRIHIFDAAGSEAGAYTVTAEPLRLVQVSVRDIVGGAALANGRASIELLESSRGVLFYGSTVDNLSSDPIFVPAQ